jgi:hypothetical protein
MSNTPLTQYENGMAELALGQHVLSFTCAERAELGRRGEALKVDTDWAMLMATATVARLVRHIQNNLRSHTASTKYHIFAPSFPTQDHTYVDETWGSRPWPLKYSEVIPTKALKCVQMGRVELVINSERQQSLLKPILDQVGGPTSMRNQTQSK